jgi:hypothetical protein
VSATIADADVAARARERLSKVDLRVEDHGPGLRIAAVADTWSRSARRRKARGIEPSSEVLVLVADLITDDSEEGAVMTMKWRFGSDRQLFESLWSHLLRGLASA